MVNSGQGQGLVRAWIVASSLIRAAPESQDPGFARPGQLDLPLILAGYRAAPPLWQPVTIRGTGAPSTLRSSLSAGGGHRATPSISF